MLGRSECTNNPPFAAVAATLISPIELIRTRVQSSFGPDAALRNVLGDLRATIASQGVRKLWTGLAPTLWRDVPFSAIYWYAYESSKRTLHKWYPHLGDDVWGGYQISFLSGAGSGMLAAVITTPFDVAKTRNQISKSHTPGLAELIRTIIREEGWAGLMSGWTARVAKVAPSCAIMISTYEVGKRVTGS